MGRWVQGHLFSVAASQACLLIFPQPCPCFDSETNSDITADKKPSYRNEKGSRSNFPSSITIPILTFPETYGPRTANAVLGCAVPLPCFPEHVVPPTHTCWHRRAMTPGAVLQPAGSRARLCLPSHPPRVPLHLFPIASGAGTHGCSIPMWLKLVAVGEVNEVGSPGVISARCYLKSCCFGVVAALQSAQG